MPKVKTLEHLRAAQKPVVAVPEYNPLENLIRRYMKAYKLNAADVGASLGCSGQNVNQQLNKPLDKWTIEQIKKYCSAVNCPLSTAYEALTKQ